MVTFAGLESDIYKDPGSAPTSWHLVFCVLSVSETACIALGGETETRNVVMIRAGVKIVHQLPNKGTHAIWMHLLVKYSVE